MYVDLDTACRVWFQFIASAATTLAYLATLFSTHSEIILKLKPYQGDIVETVVGISKSKVTYIYLAPIKQYIKLILTTNCNNRLDYCKLFHLLTDKLMSNCICALVVTYRISEFQVLELFYPNCIFFFHFT